MTKNTLSDYIVFKRAFLDDPDKPKPSGDPLRASVATEGRAGIRRIKIRDHRIISDSGYLTGGSNLGPTPAELVLAGLGGCLSHGWVLQSALAEVDLRALEIDVTTTPAPAGSKAPAGFEYTVKVQSGASPEKLREILRIVEDKSYVFNLLVNPVRIAGAIEDTSRSEVAA